jgi:putative tricarboxylic transport membrane protein
MTTLERFAGGSGMAWKDRLSAVFVIIFSGVIFFLALELPLGKRTKPGPALFPLILSVVIGLLALLLFLENLRPKGEGRNEGISTPKWRVGYLLGTLCLYAILFRPLGFLGSTWIFLVALKPIVKKKWIPVLLGSLLISLTFFFFFNYLLKVELPMGIFSK